MRYGRRLWGTVRLATARWPATISAAGDSAAAGDGTNDSDGGATAGDGVAASDGTVAINNTATSDRAKRRRGSRR